MSYDPLRHFVDSFGLAATVILYLVLVGWAFLPRTRDGQRHAATMIFDEHISEEGAGHGQ
jgi:cytochrome c oxidase cbb3-type subunit 4